MLIKILVIAEGEAGEVISKVCIFRFNYIPLN